VIDGEETSPQPLTAGVLQGSPLSPILFLFYNSPLLESLNQPAQQLSAIGFADDINLLTYSTSTAANCTALSQAHDQCLAWAATHGMRFAPQKYTLTHFTQMQGFNTGLAVQLGPVTVRPEPVVKILGLQLDSKLRWSAHSASVKRKMATQMHSLSQTTASTWGANLLTARQIYTAMI